MDLVVRLARIAAAALLTACAAGPAAQTETVSARDNTFQPETLRVPEGVSLSLTVTNDGAEDHNLVRPDQGIDSGVIAPGAATTVTIGPLARPTTFVCTLHNGMAITLVPT
ncbi:MAG: cupredoxin domain-containing protein [Egibacteraceae bacterium]